MEKYYSLSFICKSVLLFRSVLSLMARSDDYSEPIDHLAYSYGAAMGYLSCLHDLGSITDSRFDSAVQELLEFHDSLLDDL